MKKRTYLLLAFVVLLVSSNALTKIGDPPPISDGATTYRSHLNYVEAISNDSNKIIWKTIVYRDLKPERLNATLEEDVQWNIIISIEFHGDCLKIGNSNGRVYYLDKADGKVLVHNKTDSE